MRLTSYNMAVKVLHAKGCLADMVDRMWAYMEEGDTENAQCVREKALGLYSLIETAGRWSPTITDGYISVADVNFSAITYPSVFAALNFRSNGIKVSNGFTTYGGDADDVASDTAHSFNDFISSDDDLIQIGYRKTGDSMLNGTVRSSFLFTSFTSENIGTPIGSPMYAFTQQNEPFEDAKPHCLTDAQILSVVGKIDELCECKC